jgi:nitrate reductase delta subunit
VSGVRGGAIILGSQLLRYPDAGYVHQLQAFVELVDQLGCGITPELRAFTDEAATLAVGTLEERYTQAFDMTVACALEVGWHLFGEDYARGAFLVEMREHLRTHGVDEGTELPDHLGTLLELITRLPQEEAVGLIDRALLPAIDRVLPGLRGISSPFASIVQAVREVLVAERPVVPEVQHV